MCNMDIKNDTIVLEVIEKYPKLPDIFVGKGFTPLKDTVLRQKIASVTTIEEACSKMGLNVQEFVDELNKAASD